MRGFFLKIHMLRHQKYFVHTLHIIIYGHICNNNSLFHHIFSQKIVAFKKLLGNTMVVLEGIFPC